MFDWSTGKLAGTIVGFPDDTSAIDFILDADIVKKIYSEWDEGKYGELLDYGGGVKAITAKMLVAAGQDFLTSIKNIGQVRASQIMSEVEAVLGEVPYGSGL